MPGIAKAAFQALGKLWSARETETQRDAERFLWHKVKTEKGCRYGKKLNGQWMNLPDSELVRREA